MANMLYQPECHEAVRQQTQGPARLPLRRRTTRKGYQVGCHLARDLPRCPFRKYIAPWEEGRSMLRPYSVATVTGGVFMTQTASCPASLARWIDT